jgi:hypothetical protein
LACAVLGLCGYGCATDQIVELGERVGHLENAEAKW